MDFTQFYMIELNSALRHLILVVGAKKMPLYWFPLRKKKRLFVNDRSSFFD